MNASTRFCSIATRTSPSPAVAAMRATPRNWSAVRLPWSTRTVTAA